MEKEEKHTKTSKLQSVLEFDKFNTTKIPLKKGNRKCREGDMGALLSRILGEGLTAEVTSDRIPGK